MSIELLKNIPSLYNTCNWENRLVIYCHQKDHRADFVSNTKSFGHKFEMSKNVTGGIRR